MGNTKLVIMNLHLGLVFGGGYTLEDAGLGFRDGRRKSPLPYASWQGTLRYTVREAY